MQAGRNNSEQMYIGIYAGGKLWAVMLSVIASAQIVD